MAKKQIVVLAAATALTATLAPAAAYAEEGAAADQVPAIEINALASTEQTPTIEQTGEDAFDQALFATPDQDGEAAIAPQSDSGALAENAGDSALATSSNATDPGYTTTYDYNAGLYDAASGNYTGVYEATLNKNNAADETIGMPSIADSNLADAPTTESPAIIQGAAVGYENKTGATEYETIKERLDPYAEFK